MGIIYDAISTLPYVLAQVTSLWAWIMPKNVFWNGHLWFNWALKGINFILKVETLMNCLQDCTLFIKITKEDRTVFILLSLLGRVIVAVEQSVWGLVTNDLAYRRCKIQQKSFITLFREEKSFFQLSAFNKLEKCSWKTLSQSQLNNLFGATPLNIMTLSIMTFSIKTLSIMTLILATFSITKLSITMIDARNSA